MQTFFSKRSSGSLMSLLGVFSLVFMGFSPVEAAVKRSVTNVNTGVEYTELQEAIDAAAVGDVLKARGTFVGSFVINKSLTLEGVDRLERKSGDCGCHSSHKKRRIATVLDGNQAGRVLDITLFSSEVILRNLTIQNGIADNGGGIRNTGTLTLEKVNLVNNTATASGGGIYNFSGATEGVLNIFNSKISLNRAVDGGGISNNLNSYVIINSSLISQNTATLGSGGGLASASGFNSINSTIFEKNSAFVGGGALAHTITLFGASLSTLTDVIITENTTTGNGAGINNSEGQLLLDNSHVYKNTAVGNGGGVYNGNFLTKLSVTTIANSLINQNTAANGGGAFDDNTLVGLLNIVNSEVINNIPNNVSTP